MNYEEFEGEVLTLARELAQAEPGNDNMDLRIAADLRNAYPDMSVSHSLGLAMRARRIVEGKEQQKKEAAAR